ncbi:MAG: hypothetical protein ACM33B_06520 [Pseudomonadota bacterium]
MRRVVVSRIALLAAVALAAAGVAGAALHASAPAETDAYGDARLGSLRVGSGVRMTARDADLRGMWIDESVACDTNRRLRVAVLIDWSRGVAHRRVTRSGAFLAPNCGEGGPNVGFTLTARAARLACADGRWRPGRYSLMTTTTEPTKALRAAASLVLTATRPC